MLYLITLLMTITTVSTDKKPTLIYVGDPMCSWCYGISEELSETMTALEGEVDFKLLVGGLRPGGGDKWNTEFKTFLRHHWEEVSNASGQPFDYTLLSAESFDYDTEPSCRAVVVVQSMDKSKEFEFFKAVQKGFYLNGNDPKQVVFLVLEHNGKMQVIAQGFAKSADMVAAINGQIK